MAVANPSVLNIAWRSGTKKKRTTTLISCSFACSETGIFFFNDKLKCLGISCVVARGQIFLHKPVAKTNNAGATGINMFQKSNKPSVGLKNRLKKIKRPTNHTRVCAIRHISKDLPESLLFVKGITLA